MKYLFLLTLLLTSNVFAKTNVVDGDVDIVKGCKVGKIIVDTGNVLDTRAIVVRCHNETVTTTTIEKTPVTTVIIDGIKYYRRDK